MGQGSCQRGKSRTGSSADGLAQTPVARPPHRDTHIGRTARKRGCEDLVTRGVYRQPPHRGSVQHGRSEGGNSDASRFYEKPGTGRRAPHDESAPDGSLDSVARRPGDSHAEPAQHRSVCNSVGPGHTGGTEGLERGTAHTKRIGQSVPVNTLRRKSVARHRAPSMAHWSRSYTGKRRSSVLAAKFESGLRRISYELFLYLVFIVLSPLSALQKASRASQRRPAALQVSFLHRVLRKRQEGRLRTHRPILPKDHL